MRSKRAFLAKSGLITPIPTSTPALCNFVMVVSEEIGGPGKLLNIRIGCYTKIEGVKHSATIPGGGIWPGRGKNNPDVCFG